MRTPRDDDRLNRPDDKTAARAATSTAPHQVPAHHAWGWRLVILLSSLWAGLAVALISGGH